MVTIHGLDKLRERLVHGLKRKEIKREAIVLRHNMAAYREKQDDRRIEEERSRQKHARNQTHLLRDSYTGLIFRGQALGAIFFGVGFASLALFVQSPAYVPRVAGQCNSGGCTLMASTTSGSGGYV